MIRKLSKDISSKQHEIKKNKFLRIFGDTLHRKEFWNLNRTSVTRGFAIGMFWAFVPLPFQMVFSTITAFIFRGNIAIAVSLVWLTNPFTMPIIFYGTYKLGAFILGREELPFQFEPTFTWMMDKFDAIVIPLFTGSIVVGSVFSLLSFYIVKYLWYRSTHKEMVKKNKNFKFFSKDTK